MLNNGAGLIGSATPTIAPASHPTGATASPARLPLEVTALLSATNAAASPVILSGDDIKRDPSSVSNVHPLLKRYLPVTQQNFTDEQNQAAEKLREQMLNALDFIIGKKNIDAKKEDMKVEQRYNARVKNAPKGAVIIRPTKTPTPAQNGVTRLIQIIKSMPLNQLGSPMGIGIIRLELGKARATLNLEEFKTNQKNYNEALDKALNAYKLVFKSV